MEKKKKSEWTSQLLMLMVLFFCAACSSSDDSNEEADETSPATIEYLCSSNLWAYAPDKGIKEGEAYENFTFYRIGELLGCTVGANGKDPKKYLFTFQAPTVTLKEMDILTKEVPGGEKRTLTVYKLSKPKYPNQRFLQINGKPYMATIGGGIDLK